MSEGEGGSQPLDRAQEAFERALDRLEAAESEDVASKLKQQSEAVGDFAEELAEVVIAGVPETVLPEFCGALADECPHVTKSSISSQVKAEIERLSAQGSEGSKSVNQFLEDSIEDLIVVRSTDAKQSAIYRWWFEQGFVIETGEQATSHMHYQSLREAILDASGIWTTKPPKHIAEDWPAFIGPLIEARYETVTTRGARTCAVDSLRNHIRRSRAFASIEDMVTHQGISIDDDPDEGEPTEIFVPNQDISRIGDDHSIEERALQVELDARGLTVGRISGVSESTFVNRQKATYWVLSADIADPGTYEPDPSDPFEDFEDMLDEDRDRREQEPDREPGIISSSDPDLDPATDGNSSDLGGMDQ